MMRNLFTSKVSGLKGMGLFVSAIVLAIALARSLDSPEFLALPIAESPAAQLESTAAVGLEEGDFAIQERYGRRWIHYATVSRSDRSFRRMFIAANDASRIEAGRPLPNETIILMESWYSPEAPGIVFIKQKLNGSWQYGSFTPAQPNYRLSDRNSCHSCHVPFSDADYTLTKPLLEAALQRRQLQFAHCDRAGRSPCASEAYWPDASRTRR